MNRFIPFVLLLLFSLCVAAQSVIEIPSTDGYAVRIELTATDIRVNQPCPNGYNYDVVFDYDITFTGNNIPSGGLWTLQGNVGCGANNLYLSLPTRGGQGTATTNGNAYEADCGVAPTVGDLLCEDLVITVQGPGISSQEYNLSLVLPVSFVAFTATSVGKLVQLDWKTSAETDNDFFEVQRSADAITWKNLGNVAGSGFAEATTTYRFTDAEASGNEVYYRLRQVDYDGTFTFSPIVRVVLERGEFSAFPNPTYGPLTIAGGGPVRITDLAGRTLLSTNGIGGDNATTLDLSGLRPGLYLVQTRDGLQKVLRH